VCCSTGATVSRHSLRPRLTLLDRPTNRNSSITSARIRGLRRCGGRDNDLAAQSGGQCLVIYHPDDAVELRERKSASSCACPMRAVRHATNGCLKSSCRERCRPISIRLPARSSAYTRWTCAPTGGNLPKQQCRALARHSSYDYSPGPAVPRRVAVGTGGVRADLIACFAAAAPFEVVKGFAIGRSVFHDVARAWFADSMSDSAAIEAMAHRFSTLVNAWRKARAVVAT